MALMAEISESELVAQLRAGRSSAYAALMRRNNQRLYRLARGVLGDDAEAEEAVQAGYVRAFTHIDSFKGEASVSTWLARIVLNEAMTRQRRRRPTVDIDTVSEQALDADAEPAAIGTRREPSPEQALARREISRAIERAVDALPAAFRAVFILRAIEQLNIEETAISLGIPEETVKTGSIARTNCCARPSHGISMPSSRTPSPSWAGAAIDSWRWSWNASICLIHRRP